MDFLILYLRGVRACLPPMMDTAAYMVVTSLLLLFVLATCQPALPDISDPCANAGKFENTYDMPKAVFNSLGLELELLSSK